MNKFISEAVYMQETYPNEFKEAIKAFKKKMKQSAKERYYPERYLYKLVNILGDKEKISVIKGLNKEGIPNDVIMRIMGGMSKYSGKIKTKAERMEYYEMVEKALRKNERNEIIQDAINKAQEKGIKRLYKESQERMKKTRNNLDKLEKEIRLYEKKTNWKIQESLGNKRKIKEEYINKKMKYLKELKEIGNKLKEEKKRLIKETKIYGEQNETVNRNMNNVWIYNPLEYSKDFLAYYLFGNTMNENYQENYNKENEIKKLIEKDFNNRKFLINYF